MDAAVFTNSLPTLPVELIFSILLSSTSPLPFSETPYDTEQLCVLSLIPGFRDQAQTMLFHTVILEEEIRARQFIEHSRRWTDGVERVKKLIIIGNAEDEEERYQVELDTALEVLEMGVIAGVESLDVAQIAGFEPAEHRLRSPSLVGLKHLVCFRNPVNPKSFLFPPVPPGPFQLETLTIAPHTALFRLDASCVRSLTVVCSDQQPYFGAETIRSILRQATDLVNISLPSFCWHLLRFYPTSAKSLTFNTIRDNIEQDAQIRTIFPIPSLETLILYVDGRNPGQEHLVEHLDELVRGGNLKEVQLRSAREVDLSDLVSWNEMVQEWEWCGCRVWFNSD